MSIWLSSSSRAPAIGKVQATVQHDNAKQTLDPLASGYQQQEFSYLTLLTAQRTCFQANLVYLESLLQQHRRVCRSKVRAEQAERVNDSSEKGETAKSTQLARSASRYGLYSAVCRRPAERGAPLSEGSPEWSCGAIIYFQAVFRPGMIMNCAFHMGVMLAVAVHMVFGCCLHHAHASGPRIGLPLSVDATCPCGHHDHQHEGLPGDHRSGDQDCDGDKCVFTLPKSGNSSLVTVGANSLPFICVMPTPPEMDGIDTVDTMPHHCGLPVPLHLLNQVLLI